METPEYFRYLAGRCRSLAQEVNDEHDPVVRDLLRMAGKFEDRAAHKAARERTDAA